MRNLYYVRTIRGMPVRLHYTWIIAALLGIPIIVEVICAAGGSKYENSAASRQPAAVLDRMCEGAR